MPITDKFVRLPINSILVDRQNRQRQEIKVEDLLDSISKHGVLQPIIVRNANANWDENNDPGEDLVWLVAGERRLEASKKLNLPDIPVRFLESMSPLEQQLIELEENTKRKDLSWQEQAKAVAKIHQLHQELDPDWTITKTAETLGISNYFVSANIRAESNLHDPKISSAVSCIGAVNILARRNQRAAGEALEELLAPTGQQPATQPLQDSILLEDLLTWLPNYSGPTFNILHCDFPYGIEVFAGETATQMTGGEYYQDSTEKYKELLFCLANNINKIFSLSGHIFFWYSQRHLAYTLDTFSVLCPDIEFSPFPLIWHKTDNSGILGKFRHNPRHIYETCLFGTRNQRQLVEQKGDVYGCPINKTLHPSCKPEPMLKHFFSMVIDQNSTLFDPTCGSGSALRAAESLGAKTVLGLEENPEFYKSSVQAMKTFRTLTAANQKFANITPSTK